jgi:leucyl/phenylalanyl-tRNA---protein transferase
VARVEPAPTNWVFPDRLSGADVVAVGADLAPGTLLAAYRRGLFPMRITRGGRLGWWSPDPRGVIPLAGFRLPRSLVRSIRRYRVTYDGAFAAVIRGCADRRRPHGWIDASFIDAYTELHRLGWVHSVEAWTTDGRLAGGTYGVAVGGLFAAESMFRNLDLGVESTDAGKVAVAALVERLAGGGADLLDVQWTTPHLRALGAVDVPRQEYLVRVAAAVGQGDAWTGYPPDGG